MINSLLNAPITDNQINVLARHKEKTIQEKLIPISVLAQENGV